MPPPVVSGPGISVNYDGQMHPDTAVMRINHREQSERSDAFYDTIRSRHYKNRFTRFLVRSLVKSRDASDEGPPTLDFKRNRIYFEHYAGKQITGIHTTQANVFSPRDSSQKVGWIQRFIDKLHIRTDGKQLAENLLFKVGDTINPYVMGINEELLRNLPNLSTAYFVVIPDPRDSTGVTVHIFARDNWSISADARLGTEQNYLSVFDRNFLGTGDELKLIFTCEEPIRKFGGEINYTTRNLLGSFADITLKLGVGSVQNTAQFIVERPFILPSDWAMGFSIGRNYTREKQIRADTSYYINRFHLDGWIGKSWCLDWRNGTNVYLAASFDKERYDKRPPIETGMHPYYHNSETLLFSLGFSRRNYFQGNMIYGYGRTEDIPYGFRTELLFGRQWGERLGRRDYLGIRGYWGNLVGDNYLEAGLGAGTFFTPNYTIQQAVISSHIKYFTPLLRVRTSYLRQFGTLSMTMGFNRMEGEREALRYEKWRGIRGLGSSYWLTGYNRLTLSSETVLFTPIFLYHFRFAFFVFGDAGWLGDNNNIFRNRFTGAVGLGVRIKNERLIFNNIQLRVGYAFNRPSEVGYSYFSISNEQDFQDANFQASQPQIIEYK